MGAPVATSVQERPQSPESSPPPKLSHTSDNINSSKHNSTHTPTILNPTSATQNSTSSPTPIASVTTKQNCVDSTLTNKASSTSQSKPINDSNQIAKESSLVNSDPEKPCSNKLSTNDTEKLQVTPTKTSTLSSSHLTPKVDTKTLLTPSSTAKNSVSKVGILKPPIGKTLIDSTKKNPTKNLNSTTSSERKKARSPARRISSNPDSEYFQINSGLFAADGSPLEKRNFPSLGVIARASPIADQGRSFFSHFNSSSRKSAPSSPTSSIPSPDIKPRTFNFDNDDTIHLGPARRLQPSVSDIRTKLPASLQKSSHNNDFGRSSIPSPGLKTSGSASSIGDKETADQESHLSHQHRTPVDHPSSTDQTRHVVGGPKVSGSRRNSTVVKKEEKVSRSSVHSEEKTAPTVQQVVVHDSNGRQTTHHIVISQDAYNGSQENLQVASSWKTHSLQVVDQSSVKCTPGSGRSAKSDPQGPGSLLVNKQASNVQQNIIARSRAVQTSVTVQAPKKTYSQNKASSIASQPHDNQVQGDLTTKHGISATEPNNCDVVKAKAKSQLNAGHQGSSASQHGNQSQNMNRSPPCQIRVVNGQTVVVHDRKEANTQGMSASDLAILQTQDTAESTTIAEVATEGPNTERNECGSSPYSHSNGLGHIYSSDKTTEMDMDTTNESQILGNSSSDKIPCDSASSQASRQNPSNAAIVSQQNANHVNGKLDPCTKISGQSLEKETSFSSKSEHATDNAAWSAIQSTKQSSIGPKSDTEKATIASMKKSTDDVGSNCFATTDELQHKTNSDMHVALTPKKRRASVSPETLAATVSLSVTEKASEFVSSVHGSETGTDRNSSNSHPQHGILDPEKTTTGEGHLCSKATDQGMLNMTSTGKDRITVCEGLNPDVNNEMPRVASISANACTNRETATDFLTKHSTENANTKTRSTTRPHVIASPATSDLKRENVIQQNTKVADKQNVTGSKLNAGTEGNEIVNISAAEAIASSITGQVSTGSSASVPIPRVCKIPLTKAHVNSDLRQSSQVLEKATNANGVAFSSAGTTTARTKSSCAPSIAPAPRPVCKISDKSEKVNGQAAGPTKIAPAVSGTTPSTTVSPADNSAERTSEAPPSSPCKPARIPPHLKFEDDEHVTIWNRLEKRKIAGNAAPLGRNLERYLRLHLDCEVYESQDYDASGSKNSRKRPKVSPQDAKAGDHIVIWNRVEKRKIAGNAAPLAKNLKVYLEKRPYCEVYHNQDKELKEAEARNKSGTVKEECVERRTKEEDCLEEWKKYDDSMHADQINAMYKTDYEQTAELFLLEGDENDDVSPVVMTGPTAVEDSSHVMIDLDQFLAIGPSDEEMESEDGVFSGTLPKLMANFEIPNSS